MDCSRWTLLCSLAKNEGNNFAIKDRSCEHYIIRNSTFIRQRIELIVQNVVKNIILSICNFVCGKWKVENFPVESVKIYCHLDFAVPFF